jgi:hypothetical protein
MTKNTNGFLRWSVIALIAAAPLCAQDGGWSKVNWGVQLGALIPLDFKGYYLDYETGFGLAGYGEKVWSNNWALRGRLEYVKYGEASESGESWYKNGYYIRKCSSYQTGLMADVIYYGLSNNLYLFGGVGYFYIVDTWSDVWSDGSDVGSDTVSAPYLSLGIGWNFTPHLGLEVKYTVAYIQASVLYRF